ncbi:MAG: hypothetical protein QNJ22_09045 [Desulfosarcinaceae bacterium]|nr:hypothetical protein [Desulfosarcinaceae bacterium]
MWHNNKSVVSVYAHVNTKTAYAIIDGMSGWKRINPTSADGVTNVLDVLNAAKANGKKVNVFIGSDELVSAAYMS